MIELVTSDGGKIRSNLVTRLKSAGAVELDEHTVFTASTEQLAHILIRMRGRRPLFVIRAIDIRSDDTPSALPRSTPNPLTIDITVAEFEHP